MRDERALPDAGNALPDVLVEIGERLQGEARLDAGVVLDLALHGVVGEREHPAVGVVDQDDLVRAEQALRDGQRPEGVVGDDPARVTDHVSLARPQPEDAVDVEAGVHACHHRHLP